jgi:hypothetical protein
MNCENGVVQVSTFWRAPIYILEHKERRRILVSPAQSLFRGLCILSRLIGGLGLEGLDLDALRRREGRITAKERREHKERRRILVSPAQSLFRGLCVLSRLIGGLGLEGLDPDARHHVHEVPRRQSSLGQDRLRRYLVHTQSCRQVADELVLRAALRDLRDG